jgi:hypothetical protein
MLEQWSVAIADFDCGLPKLEQWSLHIADFGLQIAEKGIVLNI